MRGRYTGTVVCLLCLMMLGGACRPARHASTPDHVARLMTSFRQVPSRQTADALVELLQNRQVASEQGREILSLLISPKPVVRSAYSASRPAVFLLTYPVRGDFSGMRIRDNHAVTCDGMSYHGGGGSGGNTYGGDTFCSVDPCSVTLAPLLTELPKTVIVAREYAIELFPPDARPMEGQTPIYSCTVRTTIPIRFVNDGTQDGVFLFTDSEVDKQMQAAFAMIPQQWSSSASKVGVEVSSETGVAWRNLPADVAFKALFRDEQGRLLDIFRQPEGGALRAFAGSSGGMGWVGGINHELAEYPLTKGVHKGYLVLQPSAEGGYYDPRMGAVWGGTLELPLILTVEDCR